jgi:hypothetical protein
MLGVFLPPRFRAIIAVLLLTLAALPAFPASAGAQDTSAAQRSQALDYLATLPGLKGQLPNLRVTTDPRGDAATTGDAVWAALGEVVLNKQLRNWVKKLAASKTGWGLDQLPPVGTPVLATFVGLASKPDLKATASTVVHQGYADGTRVATQGFRADPFEADSALDSFGIFYRDDVGAYPQAAASLVSVAGARAPTPSARSHRTVMCWSRSTCSSDRSWTLTGSALTSPCRHSVPTASSSASITVTGRG